MININTKFWNKKKKLKLNQNNKNYKKNSKQKCSKCTKGHILNINVLNVNALYGKVLMWTNVNVLYVTTKCQCTKCIPDLRDLY